MRKQEIVKYFTWHTLASTKQAFNISDTTIKKLLEEFNVAEHSAREANTLRSIAKDGYDNFSTEQLTQIVQIYKSNYNVEETCSLCKIKSYFLIYLLNKEGLEFTIVKQEASRDVYERQLVTTNHQELIDFYLTPHSLKETRLKFNVSTKVIKKILSVHNVAEHNQKTINKLAREAASKTTLTKYGCKNAFQNDLVKAKCRQAKLDKYGDANYTNRDKAHMTNLERYGATEFLASEKGQLAIKTFSQNKYGADFAFQSEEFQQNTAFIKKRQETLTTRKYTTANYSDLYLQVATTKAAFAQFIKGKTVNQLITELSVSRDHIYYLLSKYQLLDQYQRDFTGTSQAETELVAFIGVDACELHNRSVLDGREIDIYIPTKKLGIEFNGTH